MGNYHDVIHHFGGVLHDLDNREYIFDNDHNERSVFDDLIDEPDHDDSVDINHLDHPAADPPTSHPAADYDSSRYDDNSVER